MAKNKKIKESSLVVNIKGYLAGAKVKSAPKRSGKDVPWYLKSLGQLKEEVVREFTILKEATDEEIKKRQTELERTMLQSREDSRKDPMDHRKEMVMMSAEKAYNNFMSLSPEEKRNFDKFAINPKLTRDIEKQRREKQEDTDKPEPRNESRPEIISFLADIDSDDLKVVDRNISDSIFSIIDKYVGRTPTRKREYAIIKNFMENVFYKEHGGKVSKYIKEKSQTFRNVTLADIVDEKLQEEIVSEMIENKIRPINKSFQDWNLLSAPLQKKIKDYYENNKANLQHKIRKEFSKVQLPKMAVSANVKRTQRLNPYTKEKQLSDQEEENSAAADLPLDIGKKR